MRRASPPREIPEWERWLVRLLFAWFVLRVVFFAVAISPEVPPDETTHVERSRIYSQVLGVPENGPETLASGRVNHIPALYYWTMGRVINLNPSAGLELLVLRLFNGLLALMTIGYGYRFMLRLSGFPFARVLFVALLSNTLMFTGLAASVNYDNLVNLLAAIAIYRLFVFFAEPGPVQVWGLVLALLAGGLAKQSFLPLAFLVAVAAVVHAWGRWPGIIEQAIGWFRRPTRRSVGLCAAVLLALALNLILYGGNLVRFGKLVPSFDQIVGIENALENRIFARDYIVREFRDGRIDFDAAMEMADRIPHAGDRRFAKILLNLARTPDSELMGPAAYGAAWSLRMSRLAVGYVGHRIMLKTTFESVLYVALFIAALLVLFWKRRRLRGSEVGYAALIVVGYALVLLWGVNYPTYRETHSLELGLQGRYLFPVWVPLCGVAAHGLLFTATPRVQAVLALLIAGFFVYGDLPAFLLAADSTWFTSGPGLPSPGAGG